MSLRPAWAVLSDPASTSKQKLDYLRDELVHVSEDSVTLAKGQTLVKCEQEATGKVC